MTGRANNDTIKLYEMKKTRKERLAIIKRGTSEEKPIFAVDTDTNKFASYVRNIPSKADYYDVALHGMPTYVEFFGEPIDAYTLANIIRNRSDYIKGSKIRLLSCSTGDISRTGDCVAQILANSLGVIVEAPTKILWVSADGSFTIGSKKYSNNGEMKLFYPRE